MGSALLPGILTQGGSLASQWPYTSQLTLSSLGPSQLPWESGWWQYLSVGPFLRWEHMQAQREEVRHPSSPNKLMAGLRPKYKLALPSRHSLPCSLLFCHSALLGLPECAKLIPAPGPLHLLPLLLIGSSPRSLKDAFLRVHMSLSQRAASFPSVTFSSHTVISLLYNISCACCVFLCFLSLCKHLEGRDFLHLIHS